MKKQNIHGILRNARTSKRLSLRDIEKLSRGSITNAYVSHLERGILKNPSPEILRTLAQILDLNFLRLMILAGHITKKELRGKL